MIESEVVKLLWDFKIQTDQRIDHNKPDIVVLDKQPRSCLIIDVAFPFDTGVKNKEQDKVENYQARGVLLGILGRGVPPRSPNPDPISDLNMLFQT